MIKDIIYFLKLFFLLKAKEVFFIFKSLTQLINTINNKIKNFEVKGTIDYLLPPKVTLIGSVLMISDISRGLSFTAEVTSSGTLKDFKNVL